MITVTLYGTSACHRYQKMKKLVLDESVRLTLPVKMDEVSETAQLVQFSPLSLPRLYVQDELVASQNPPRRQEIARIFEQANKV